MTLVLALKALDGVVLASDGQATTQDPIAPTRADAEDKLFTLHGRIAFGCAGSAGLQQRVVAALVEKISEASCARPIAELRPILHGVVNELQHRAVEEHVPLGDGGPPAHIEILFAGWSGGEPWIYEITANGADEVHPHGEAIGHARHFPYYLMVSTLHYELLERGVEQVRVMAYRAVVDAIKTDAGALGPPVHLVLVTAAGAQPLRGERLQAVHDSLNGWKTQEHDIFRALPGSPPAGDQVAQKLSSGIDAEPEAS
jgi:20S proteasome alpha/beta subunit